MPQGTLSHKTHLILRAVAVDLDHVVTKATSATTSSCTATTAHSRREASA
jgi:hypothetical protein